MSDPERARRVEALFAALFDAASDERTLALGAAENAGVAGEVADLLQAHDALAATPADFLERLDTRSAGALIEAADAPQQITAIGRYPVIRQLGRGGMGVVYLARDPRLDRPVALKLLPPSRSADPAAAERLFAEARAASALDHPNIGTVYEIAEAEDGRLFIAMAYHEGESLRERTARGPFTREEAVGFGIQLADGLAAAHAHGIVHRDIKPENLMITGSGVLKIVDFGVATSAGGSGDESPVTRGTPAYMSPEQSGGAPVDHRTDVWSAGVVLYEMLTGSRPDAVITPAAWRAIPADLARILRRCLQPDPRHRLNSAAALATGLRAIQQRPKRRRVAAGLAAGVAAAAAVVLALDLSGGPPDSLSVTITGGAPAIAVLPFEVRGDEELEIWREGMVDLISSNLDGVTGLRTIDSRTMLVGWHGEVERAGPLDFDRAVALARRNGAAHAVFGSVVSSGAGIRLDARIHSVADGRSLGAVHVAGPADSIFALVDRLSMALLGAVWQGRERPTAEVNLARLTTGSLPALKAYLDGERALRHADLAGAVAEYERAVALDSTFAFALYRLGVTRGWLGDDNGPAELAIAALEQAMRHAGRLPERERLLLRSALDLHVPQPYDLTATLATLRTATRRYPDDPDAWYWLGEIAYHTGDQLLLDRTESDSAFGIAASLDPGFALSYVHLIHSAVDHRPDSARAAQLLEAYHRAAPAGRVGRDNELSLALAFGDSGTRSRALASIAAGEGHFAGYGTLDHPRFWGTAIEAIRAGPRPDNAFGRFLATNEVKFTVGLGRVTAALRLMKNPVFPAAARAAMLHRMRQGGLPVDPGLLDEAAAAALAADTPEDGSTTHAAVFYAGAWAADRGRRDDLQRAVLRLRRSAARLVTAGDSARARFVGAAADALEGRGVRRWSDAERGYRMMADAQRRATWHESTGGAFINETIRWWLADVLEELGRPEEALRYFESLPREVPAVEHRARIHERLGDSAGARAAYEFVALAWRGADPELRLRGEEAASAARRLEGAAAQRLGGSAAGAATAR